jgi:hypothetical protein
VKCGRERPALAQAIQAFSNGGGSSRRNKRMEIKGEQLEPQCASSIIFANFLPRLYESERPVTSGDDCFRCERALDDAGIPFKLIVQSDSHLLIDVEDRFLWPALEALHQAGFTAEV